MSAAGSARLIPLHIANCSASTRAYAPPRETFQFFFSPHLIVRTGHVLARSETDRAGERNPPCQPLMTGAANLKGSDPMTKFLAAALAVVAVAVTSPAFAATTDLMNLYFIGR